MLSELNKEKKLSTAVKMHRDACEADIDFQKEAHKSFRLVDGHQWTDEEKRILEEDMRPYLTFNIAKSYIDLVMGVDEDTKQKYLASPVEQTDGFLCEVLNNVTEWIYDNQNIDDEQSDAAKSATICGRGFIGIDFVPDPKKIGEIKINVNFIPVNEVKVDPTTTKGDMSNASYICWEKWFGLEDFKVAYPDFAKDVKEILETGKVSPDLYLNDTESGVFESNYEDDDSDYEKPLDSSYYDRAKKQIRVIHMEYWEAYKRYYAFNPATKQIEEFDPKYLENLKSYFESAGERFDYFTMPDKKVKWLQFTADKILYDDDAPVPFDCFSIVSATGFREYSKRGFRYYGLGRLLEDPQGEVNKRWSQALQMLNNQVQPGLYAEADAFADERQARQSLKEAGGITIMQKGAIRGGKIQERNVPNFPAAPMQLEELAQKMAHKVSGVNPDLLGYDSGRQEPGVVVRMRQQRGMTLLKPILKSFNNMRKEVFRRILSVVTEYMPDSQVSRILGNNSAYIIQDGVIIDRKTGAMAQFRDTKNLRYDVVAEPAPGSMSNRMLELKIYTDMMQAGMPVPPEMMIDKLDMSESERTKWKEFLAQQREQAAQGAAEERQIKLMLAQAKLQQDGARIAVDAQNKEGKLVLQAQREQHRQGLDWANAETNRQRVENEDKRAELDFTARIAQVEANRGNRQNQASNR